MYAVACIFAANHAYLQQIIYRFVCPYDLYFFLWLYLWAFSYLLVKVVNVLHDSLPESVFFTNLSYSVALISTFTKKFDCDNINLLLSVINIFTILCNLFQMIWMIWGCSTSFVFCCVSLPVSLSVSSKNMHFKWKH